MVGVTANSNDDELTSVNSPMVRYLLKERENHARSQKHDYSHIFRKKSYFDLIRISTIAMAIEFAYAAETSFVSPILLQLGIDHKHMTMAWGLSPLIGFFFAPVLGPLSDRCKLSWGRRRPIITILSAGILVGLILVPHGQYLGLLLGDVGYNYTAYETLNQYNSSEGSVAALLAPVDNGPRASNFKYGTIFTIIGMVLLDFDADTLQTPARTYLLDLCISEDHTRGLTTITLFAGIGGTIGYAIGGIDWETTQIGSFLGGNIPTVFGLVTIIFIICYIITITAFREIPLKLMEQDDMLKPLTASDIKRELSKNKSANYYIQQLATLEQQTAEQNGVEKPHRSPDDNYQTDSETCLDKGTVSADIPETSKPAELLEEKDEKPVTLLQYLRTIFVMPPSMIMLLLTNLFCWMGHVTYCLYFTDFVGEAVFNGDPTAPPHSEAADLYDAGVRFGCWGMSIYAFSCSVYCISVSKLMSWFGTKAVYIASIVYYGAGMLILGIWPTKWGVLVFSTSAGVLYGTLFTMPYILVANYHTKNCFRVRKGETVPLKQSRGLGTDVAIISSMVFVAQLIVSMSIGPLVAWLNTTCAVLYASAALAFLASICAMFVLYV